MLSDKIVKASIPLTALWTENDLVATAYEGSPLALLIHHQLEKNIQSNVFYASNKDFGNSDLETRLTTIANNLANIGSLNGVESVTGIDTNQVLDTHISAAAGKIKQHISIIKNVVKPAVMDLIERINAALKSVTNESILDVEIIQFEVPKSFSNNFFVAPLGKYQDKDNAIPYKLVGLPNLDWTTLVEKLAIGDSEVDDENLSFILSAGKENIQQLFDSVFGNGQSPVKTNKNIGDFLKDSKFNTQYNLAMYLWANNFFDNPVEGTNATLIDYNNQLAAIREMAGANLQRLVQVHQSNLESKVLVKSFGDGYVEVYSNVYEDFLENGGVPEALLGLIYSDSKSYTYDNIIARTAELERIWNTQVGSLKLNEKARRANFIYRIALASFHEQMLEEQDGQAGLDNNILSILEKARNILDALRPEELNNITEVSLLLECRARFPNTASEQFLRDIVDVVADCPDTDVEEAAAVATLRYITTWISNQLSVKYAR
ncbi:MAG: hypothetical protein M0R77_00605 [Gammaproteobacteria bacterium]|nr:hypothetical protein [Acholeplasmataceae bacterium]MCK9529054.1 hypothetical protein [Gammaproteobacteria bacterium]